MTQWEQIKTEYREIPVPVNGQAQMLAAMEKARQKRANYRKAVKYGSLVAAAMLLILLIPDNLFRMGSKSAAPETAFQNKDTAILFDSVMEESAVDGDWWSPESGMTGGATEAPLVQENSCTSAVTESSPMEKVVFSEEELEAIAFEIAKQLQENKKDQDYKQEYSSSYDAGEHVVIDNSINYYINEQGLYVIVFEAGEIAPKEQGVMEFIIPKEVVSP